jgi:hypothetical protein
MQMPKLTKLNMPGLKRAAKLLSVTGKLAISHNHLVYLNIDDAYIHQLFPLLKIPNIEKPDYFCIHGVGAHISVIYPEENKEFKSKYLEEEYNFMLQDMVIAEINLKKYYVLLVDAPALLNIRREHGLPDKLNFKNYEIGFHITVGVSGPSTR